MRLRAITIGAALAAASILAVSAASAADLFRDPVPVAQEKRDWGGLYAGIYAGAGAIVNKGGYNLCAEKEECEAGSISLDGIGGEGWVAGGMAGWNFHLANWVLGLEVSGGFKELETTASAPGFKLTAAPEYNVDVSARVGRVLNDVTLLYALGGYSHMKYVVELTGLSDQTQNYNGWHVGAGLEHMIAEHWTIRAEYRFTQYNGESWGVPGLDIEPSSHVGRIGLAFLL